MLVWAWRGREGGLGAGKCGRVEPATVTWVGKSVEQAAWIQKAESREVVGYLAEVKELPRAAAAAAKRARLLALQ